MRQGPGTPTPSPLHDATVLPPPSEVNEHFSSFVLDHDVRLHNSLRRASRASKMSTAFVLHLRELDHASFAPTIIDAFAYTLANSHWQTMPAEIAKFLQFPDIDISRTVNHYNPGWRIQDWNTWYVGLGHHSSFWVSVEHLFR